MPAHDFADLEGDDAHADPAMAATVRTLLRQLGENPARDGLARTPHRVARALSFLTAGSRQSVRDVIGTALFEVDCDQMVLVKDIEFFSLCEHHMLPFHGRAHVAYLPSGKVVGLSKLPRLVDMFARRLQVQERLTREVAGAVHEALAARGTAVIVEATHMCMRMRGVAKQESVTVTSAMLGAFRDDALLRAELQASLGRPSVR